MGGGWGRYNLPRKGASEKKVSKPPKMCSRKKDQQKHPNMQIPEFERVIDNFREKNSDTWEILVIFLDKGRLADFESI